MLFGLGLLIFIAAAVAAVFVMQLRREDDITSLKDNTYTLKETISAPQTELLFYLEQAFEGRVVLFRPTLAQLLQLQQTSDRIRSQTLLDTIRVDYVVCDEDGKLRYAFDVRQRGSVTEDPKQKKINSVKQRVLRSVGIKLMGIQRSVSKMPPVHKFAHQLSIALGEPEILPEQRLPQPPQQQQQAQPRPAPKLEPHDPQSSGFASLTNIMGLSPDSDSGMSGMSGMHSSSH